MTTENTDKERLEETQVNQLLRTGDAAQSGGAGSDQGAEAGQGEGAGVQGELKGYPGARFAGPPRPNDLRSPSCEKTLQTALEVEETPAGQVSEALEAQRAMLSVSPAPAGGDGPADQLAETPAGNWPIPPAEELGLEDGGLGGSGGPDGGLGGGERGPSWEPGQPSCVECGGECRGHLEPRQLGTGGGPSPAGVGDTMPGPAPQLDRIPSPDPGPGGDNPAGLGNGGGLKEPEVDPGLGVWDYTDEQLIKMSVERLMEVSGIGTVDHVDAKDYAAIRDTKVLVIEKLQRMVAENRINDPELAAKIGQKLAQMEKSKMEVIQIKVGKPSDRAKPGVTLRARIGVATVGADGKAAVELEVEAS